MDWSMLLIGVPVFLAITAWVLLIRSEQRVGKLMLATLGIATATALWALAVDLRMRLHPEYASLAPWKDPATLQAAVLALVAPAVAVMGLVAAAKKAPWWFVAIVELIALPLTLVGCGAAASV